MRNYILLTIVKQLKILYRVKEWPYLLITIIGDLISYRGGIINIETEPIQIEIEGRRIIIMFDILPLGKDEVVLGMPWLREYNLRID